MLRVAVLATLLASVVAERIGIIHMHGVMEGYSQHHNFKKFVERRTGLPVHLVDAYNWAASLTPMKHQVKDILPRVQEIAAQYDKVIAIGYSQGGLIWRGMIESWDDHNVDMFISLASPQHGVYGSPPMAENFIPFLDWYSRTTIYKAIYSYLSQLISIFNYYIDPTHYQMYLEKCHFFPQLNNELGEMAEKERQKANFLRVNKLILIGGSDEDVIDPWQSTLFGFYSEQGFEGEVLPMEETTLYQEDLFGLKTMHARGDVVRCQYDGITHLQFRDHQDMMNTCIIPALEQYV